MDPRKGHDEVFLGGSCNPTTWRKDVAIPICEKANVSFYNPQVDDWHSGLIALENKAKEEAKVRLFVIDSQTRALSSCIEVAELVTRGQLVVLVIQEIEENAVINGDVIGPKERKDLNRSRSYLADLVHRVGRYMYLHILG